MELHLEHWALRALQIQVATEWRSHDQLCQCLHLATLRMILVWGSVSLGPPPLKLRNPATSGQSLWNQALLRGPGLQGRDWQQWKKWNRCQDLDAYSGLGWIFRSKSCELQNLDFMHMSTMCPLSFCRAWGSAGSLFCSSNPAFWIAQCTIKSVAISWNAQDPNPGSVGHLQEVKIFQLACCRLAGRERIPQTRCGPSFKVLFYLFRIPASGILISAHSYRFCNTSGLSYCSWTLTPPHLHSENGEARHGERRVLAPLVRVQKLFVRRVATSTQLWCMLWWSGGVGSLHLMSKVGFGASSCVSGSLASALVDVDDMGFCKRMAESHQNPQVACCLHSWSPWRKDKEANHGCGC